MENLRVYFLIVEGDHAMKTVGDYGVERAFAKCGSSESWSESVVDKDGYSARIGLKYVEFHPKKKRVRMSKIYESLCGFDSDGTEAIFYRTEDQFNPTALPLRSPKWDEETQ